MARAQLYDVYNWTPEREPDASDYILTAELEIICRAFSINRVAEPRILIETMHGGQCRLHFNHRGNLITSSDGIMLIQSLVAKGNST